MDDHGKPYLVNFDYEISLSHSYDYAAVMISKDKKVGVDIELMKEKIDLIKHKFLSVEELKASKSRYQYGRFVCELVC